MELIFSRKKNWLILKEWLTSEKVSCFPEVSCLGPQQFTFKERLTFYFLIKVVLIATQTNVLFGKWLTFGSKVFFKSKLFWTKIDSWELEKLVFCKSQSILMYSFTRQGKWCRHTDPYVPSSTGWILPPQVPSQNWDDATLGEFIFILGIWGQCKTNQSCQARYHWSIRPEHCFHQVSSSRVITKELQVLCEPCLWKAQEYTSC